MASQSILTPSDLQSNIVQKSSIAQETLLGSVDFPSLDEAYGAYGDRISNPRFVDSSQMVLGGADSEINQAGKNPSGNNELILGVGNISSTPHSSIEANRGFSNPKNWREIFPLPKPVTPQPKMKYTPPAEVNGKRMVASLSENFSDGIKECEKLVVGFFVGKRCSFGAVEKAVSKLWKLKKEVSIKLHGNGAFIFDFKDEDDRKIALETGSFYIAKNLFTVRPWSHLLEKTISKIKTVPIWAMIYGVPLHMWNNEGLSLISSFIGVPLFADDCTLTKDRLAYARICVEIDVDFSYPESIPLLIDGKISMELPVEYQWKPQRCENCKVFGHSVKNCTVKRSTRWTPKYNKVRSLQPNSNDVVNGDKGNIGAKITTVAVPVVVNEVRGDIGSIGLNSNVDASIPHVSTNIPVSKGESDKYGSENVSVANGNNGVANGNNGANIGVMSSLTNRNNGDGAENGESSDHGEWILAGKKNKKGSSGGGVTSVGASCSNALTKNGALADSMGAKKIRVSSPAKCGVKPLNSGSGTGVFITAAANGKTQKIQSPKRNPFMVYSDFKEDSRFPINRTKEMEEKKVYTPSRVVVERAPSVKKGLTEESEEENEHLNDCDFEKQLQFMSLEEQILKRKKRELHRLQWNGSAGNSSKDGSSTNQPLGRGLRSLTKKRSS